MTQPGSTALMSPQYRPASTPSPGLSNPPREQYDGLTTLRFFAALLIVFLHTLHGFGLDPTSFVEKHLAFAQGVAFFFVLSGFILTRVYPRPTDNHAVKDFYVARFARVFPTHLLCLLLYIPVAGLITLANEFHCFVATLFLVQAWTPDLRFMQFNGPDWSLSAEAFFYMCFPLLLAPMRRHPLLVTSACFLPCLIALLLCSPDMSHWVTPLGSIALPADRIVLSDPLVRLCEFATGMFLALITEKETVISWLRRWKLPLALLCAIMIAASLSSPIYLAPLAHSRFWPFIFWLRNSGGIVPYALLIAIVSLRDGRLERVLSNRLLVRLGNLSFAIYLVHTPLLGILQKNGAVFDMPPWLQYSLFLLVLWAAAELIYSLFECPAREWIVARYQRRAAAPLRIKRTSVIAGCVAAAAALLVTACQQAAEVWRVEEIRQQSPSAVAGAAFGDFFQLQGIRCVTGADGRRRRLEIAWRKVHDSDTQFVTAVHLIDWSGKIQTLLDYGQDPQKVARTSWHDEIPLPAGRLSNIAAVGIGLFPVNHCERLLKIDRGPRDWGDRRLTIPMELLMPNAADRQQTDR